MDGVPVVGHVPGALTVEPEERLSGLFDAHHERLYRLARRLAASTDDALDLVQETFLKAARAPAAIPRGLTAEEAWLVRVLINIRRDQWRKEAVRHRHDIEMSIRGNPKSDQESVLIARATVWRALDRLTPRRRAVIVMHELDGLAAAEIASLLGISVITVRWHLSRGRRHLARTLKSQMGESR